MGSRKSLDNLLDKLDSQLNAEKRKKIGKANMPLAIAGAISGVGISNLGQRGAGKTMNNNPFGSPTLRSNDPLDMKRKMRKAKQANIMSRHNKQGGNYSAGAIDEDEDQDQDLKDNIEFVDENKFKTMDWTEPDGSKTTLKFDENGTLLGKTKGKRKSSRPDKFSRDLKNKVILQEEQDKAVAKLRKMKAERDRQRSGSASITQQQASQITQEQARQRSLRQGVVGGGF